MPTPTPRALLAALAAVTSAVVVAGAASTSLRARDGRPTASLPATADLAALTSDASLRSVTGKSLPILSFEAQATGDKALSDAPIRLLVQGGIHGNEEIGPRLVTWLARRYSDGNSMLNLLPRERVAIDFLPNANPDGAHEKTRVNAHGVNLNRNFGVLWGVSRENPGNASFSEPETQAIRALFHTRHYAAAVDVHGYVNWVVSPSDPATIAASGVKASAQRASLYTRWVAALKAQMPLLAGYQLKTAGGLGDGGAFEDWAFWSEGTMAYCLEVESFQRFVKSYRPDFNDLNRLEERRSVDLYARYEAFIYRTFDAALRLRDAAAQSDHLAAAP